MRFWIGDNREGASISGISETDEEYKARRAKEKRDAWLRVGDKVWVMDQAHPAYGSVGRILALHQHSVTVEFERRGGPQFNITYKQLRRIRSRGTLS